MTRLSAADQYRRLLQSGYNPVEAALLCIVFAGVIADRRPAGAVARIDRR